ncbi:MAG TPA: tRNA 2-thiouridine(34) synthase MnmA [Polyangiaceae bacterium]|nr:tRNA 2-thiouridine(34) synthase MnmA [Polyangiaceae bacterium]
MHPDESCSCKAGSGHPLSGCATTRAFPMAPRVLLAMSGGVDSSVAAARLIENGFDVVGATLHLWDYPEEGEAKSRCCAPEDVHDARRVADVLGFPHYAFDRRELFAREVVQPFVDSYLEGETPSPCVRCNRGVKLKELFGLADRLEAQFVATGHYARVRNVDGRYELLRSLDRNKDQSYFLHMLDQARLSRLMFPVGELDKQSVRERALKLALPGASKGESQELCFVSSGRYDRFVTERAEQRVRPGPILDESGKVVGNHAGIHAFTIGQRRNLGVALGERAYVVAIDAAQGRVQLGPKEALEMRGARLEELSLAAGVELPLRCEVQVRYRGQPYPASVFMAAEGARVAFDGPVRAVAKGQYAVFYDGERVLGGGLIREALASAGD